MDFWENGRQFIYKIVSSPAKTYNGLVNHGATCYLNSLLQVLFMTEDFREAVKRHTCDHSGPELIDLHLTSLFDDLQKYPAYTYKITRKLGIDNEYEQRDAAEYFQKILGLTSREASQIFHGQQTQKTICSTCSTKTGSDTPFWNLTLALVNSYKGDYSVVSGIEEYFKDAHFRGENQMYCDACQAKSDATIKWEIKDHPEVLMLLLKRFEFDYRYMTYVKINCFVNVPCTLQIPENQTYELYAVVDHFGDLRSGHYTSTIKPHDSERWYTFDDDRVTMLTCQPFQVDNFVSSNSAYLLFYRKKKVHAADTCTQDTGEMPSPGGFSPDIYNDQFEKTEVKREKVEWAAEAEQTIEINEKPGIEGVVVVGPSGVGLSSDLYEEDQDNIVYSKQSNHQDCEKDRNDLSYSAEKLSDKDKIMTDDEEDKRGNAQADNQTVGRESLSGETRLEESVDDPNDDSVRPEGVRHRRPQEGLWGEDMHDTKQNQEVSNMHPQQVGVDMQKDEENMAMDVNRDKSGKKGREGIASTKYLDKEEERRDDEGLDNVRKNMHEDQERTQKVSQDDFKAVSVGKQDDGEGMKTEDEERKEGRGKLLTRQDLYYDDFQGKGVGKSKQNMPEDYPRFKRRTESRFYQSHEQPREEERDVKGYKQPKRGNDEHARSKGASERRERDQDGGSERVTTQKDVGAVKRARGGDEHIQRRADSSLRQAGSAGSSRVTENRGDGRESQTSKARTGLNEDTMEGSSKQSKKYHGKIIDEETHSGVKTSTVTKIIRIKTVGGGSRDSLKSFVEYDDGNAEIESEPKADTAVTLSEGVCNLQLNDSLLLKRRKEENETESTTHSNDRKMQKRHVRRRSSPLKQIGKEKKKRRKVQCFYFCRKSRKTADQTSESE